MDVGTRLVVQTLYRNLLQLSRKFDRSPLLKAYLTYPDSLRELDHSLPVQYVPGRSFEEMVRDHFRRDLEGSSRSQRESDFEERIDVGFNAMQCLNGLLGEVGKSIRVVLPTVEEEHRYERESRGGEGDRMDDESVVSDVKIVTEVEAGNVLVAHPMTLGAHHIFEKAVVLILEHSSEGSLGVILNRPTTWPLSDVIAHEGVEDGLNILEHSALFFGGPVPFQGYPESEDGHKLKFLVYHPHGTIKEHSSHVLLNGSLSVLDGLDRIRKLEADESVEWDVRNVQPLFQVCTWHEGQLEEELKDGSWFPAEISARLAIAQQWIRYDQDNGVVGEVGDGLREQPQVGETVRRVVYAGESNNEGPDPSARTDALSDKRTGDFLWKEVLRGLGGEYAAFQHFNNPGKPLDLPHP